jgi:multiple sugar transport system ATP-binding protein
MDDVMVEIDLNHLYKKYPNAAQDSVKDFDLHIKNKEFIVFVGPSGCGKSTTLRMVAGLEDISKGTLMIDHQVMNDVAPKDRGHRHGFSKLCPLPAYDGFRQHGVWFKAAEV